MYKSITGHTKVLLSRQFGIDEVLSHSKERLIVQEVRKTKGRMSNEDEKELNKTWRQELKRRYERGMCRK